MAKRRTQTQELSFGNELGVTTGEILTVKTKVDGFNPGKGFLLTATLDAGAILTSTAIVSDIFGSSFGTVATAYVTIGSLFATGSNAPNFLENGMPIVATGSAFLAPFGQAAIPLNTTTGETVMIEDAGDFTNGKDYNVAYSWVGSFVGIPFGALPQQSLLVFGVMTYEYVDHSDVIRGNGGRNTINGTGELDAIVGYGGNDKLSGLGGKDYIRGGQGADKISGNSGGDSLNGGTGADVIFGGQAGDFVMGEGGNDKLYGNRGEDYMLGHDGADKIYGGERSDYLNGGQGKDKLFGGAYGDVLHGGGKDDQLSGNKGKDELTGGGGADRFIFARNSGVDTINDFGFGRDVLDFTAFNVSRSDLGLRFDDDLDAVVISIGGNDIVILEDIASTAAITNGMLDV